MPIPTKTERIGAEENMRKDKHIETERKFLIRMPDPAVLESLPGCERSRITQTYLVSEEHVTERIRKRVYADRTVYTHTVKRRISPLSSIEEETAISEDEYRLLKQRRDPKKSKIKKQRFAIPHAGHVAEIDIFPFWQKQAMLEIELQDEHDSVPLPPYVSVLREVTGDKTYSNNSMSRSIPAEEE